MYGQQMDGQTTGWNWIKIRPTVSSNQLLTSSKYRPGPPLESLRVGDTTVVQTPSTCNLGVKFDQY